MAEIAPPPQEMAEDTAPLALDTLEDLRKRLSDLEALRDFQGLTIEAQYKELLKNEIQQRIEVRWQVILIAILVLVFMAGVLTHTAHSFSQKDISEAPASLLVVMFVTPIVSISTITVMLLFGAFRQFKDEDIKNINLPSIAGEVIKSSTGS